MDEPAEMQTRLYPCLAGLTVVGGIGARLFRISFSGEMAYELSLPAFCGQRIAGVVGAGRDFIITPYGTEALGVMRIEKGHVAGGELNGHSTAQDLGMGKMMSTKKDYIGRVMAGRPGMTDPSRPQVVGFKPIDRTKRLRSGAHLIAQGVAATAQNDEGFMSSAAYSPMLGHWVGLGFLSRGPARMVRRTRAISARRGNSGGSVQSSIFGR